MKRALDIVLSIIGLLILLPFFPFVAILIKIDSGGPIFFRQERMGKDFCLFTIYKFRTMTANADKKGTLITAGGDNRITRVGGFLRRYKIDELPQLYNVLKGDMSFVGPRPEVSKYVQLFETEYRKLLTVRPGITDLASLRYSNEEAILGKSKALEEVYISTILPEKIKLSSHYVDSHSLMTDLKLILLTVLKAFRNNRVNAKK
jgi:lipopolysaccharide/colanic/teichoic acid biosynthesis glycosyltransferase